MIKVSKIKVEKNLKNAICQAVNEAEGFKKMPLPPRERIYDFISPIK